MANRDQANAHIDRGWAGAGKSDSGRDAGARSDAIAIQGIELTVITLSPNGLSARSPSTYPQNYPYKSRVLSKYGRLASALAFASSRAARLRARAAFASAKRSGQGIPTERDR